MRKSWLPFAALSAILVLAVPLGAEEASKEDKDAQRTAVSMDKETASEVGRKAVEEQLKAEFGVDDARIQSLRDKKLGYGGVALVLALSQKLEGGITDANVDRVLALRQGPPVMGWGRVARELGVKLGPCISQVKKVRAEARRAAAEARSAKRAERREAFKERKERAAERREERRERAAERGAGHGAEGAGGHAGGKGKP